MRVVIKVGTSTLTYGNGNMNIRRMEILCKTISDLMNSGLEIVFVSSGAIGLGVGKLGLKGKPSDIPSKQAAAAVGQCELMYLYDKLFQEYNHTVAQILMTGADFECEERFENFRNTLNRLLELGALPIINENDTIATSEIKVGDNDTLSAITAMGVKADMLVLLSDIDGLYTADPHTVTDATLIPQVFEIDSKIKAIAGSKGSELATGGMATKIHAAELCMEAGIDMVIANGSDPQVLYDIFEGKPVGTRFVGRKK
ncbi:MAG: glutamate 5-kinase [Faecalimonas sp.]|nr:glutamate 5-kinase [Faecalimonas sp.]